MISTTDDMIAHFVPRWPTNPYHTELARHLAAFGVTVKDESRLKQIYSEIGAGGNKPDVVHVHALPRFSFRPVNFARFFMFVLRLLRLQRSGVAVVWTVHDIAHHEALYPSIDRFFSTLLYRRADAVILHSQGARDMVERTWRVRREHGVFIVHHGHFIDCYPPRADKSDSRAALGLPRDGLLFLFLGNIRPYKGVVPLVRAFKRIAGEDMHLVIAGETLFDELRSDIEREIDGHPRIKFFPRFVSDADVRSYMGAADVVVFPYTKALTSGALILAMSFGRACIAPQMGALGDTLDDAGGVLYDPENPEALSQALLEAVRRRSSLERMGEHNRSRAEGWSWGDAAHKTADVYRGCFPSIEQSPPVLISSND